MQNYSSANTWVNTKQGKMPSLYKQIIFPNGGIVVDYGCGNETALLEEKAKSDGAIWYGYDLNWKPDQDTLNVLNNGVDLAIACNLLNVIDDDEEVKRIISLLVEHSDNTIFQIYTGNNSDIGKLTKNDCWQRNNKISWYVDLIRSMGYDANSKSNYIYCRKEGV